MAFEMSLPHAPRIQQVAADGAEQTAQDEQQWDIYYSVQKALQQQAAGGEEQQGEDAPAAAAATPLPPQPSDPQKVLEKLLSARGELDVITDLVTFVEQQQFLAVEGIHRHPPTLEERLRARSLRLVTSKQQLRGAAERVQKGLAALQAQAQVDNRLLADLAQLMQRWKLRRHGLAAGLFYADISLSLRGSLAEGVSQEGAHCNIIQDTNGDACIVESTASGKRKAVRGWQHIHAVLECKQQLLAWRVLQQVLGVQSREKQYEADPDGAVAAVLNAAAAAVAACLAAVHQAVAGSSSGAEAAAMDVDSSLDSGSDRTGSVATQQAAAAAAVAAAAQPSSMLSSAAQDIQAALLLPGFQQQLESQALLLLSHQMAGGGSSGAAVAAAAPQQQGVLDSLLRWLQHAALCRRVASSLQRWAAAAPGIRSIRQVGTHEEFAAVWQLLGGRSGAVPVLVIVQGSSVRVEGASSLQPAALQRSLSKTELERLLTIL